MNLCNKYINQYDRIIITGFSQGGALSYIAGYYLSREIPRFLSIITFSSPRVGNIHFMNHLKHISKDIKMYYYGKDPVPNLLNIPNYHPLPNIKWIETNTDKIVSNK